MAAEPSIAQLAQHWLQLDRDDVTRSEIQSLLDAENVAELELRLRHRIAFGTAGLRASMSAGFARMNKLTVIQASQGLAEYILAQDSASAAKGIVIGHDARHNSADFARLTAAVFLDKGFTIHWLGQCHTPLVPFCVGKYSAAGGVMVTASHNPKRDNGYKVYWANGCQIIPPHDRGIAQSIEANLQPSDASWDLQALETHLDRVHWVYDEAKSEYTRRVVDAAGWSRVSGDDLPGFTYTPMHGVGLTIFDDLCAAIGVSESVHVVVSQAQPDPEFPTVTFPNPEEKGALDEAKKTATAAGHKLILANDPDADRFTACEFVDGEWIQLTGNQLGVLLGAYALEQYKESARYSPAAKVAMLASAVSSRMLAHMAKTTNAFHFEETLTGFKWLGNRAQTLDAQGYKTLYAYEEAIGFMLSDVVYDKDGIAAAALFLAAAKQWAAQSLTPWARLQQLYTEFGHFEEANTYLVSPSPETTAKVFAAVRTSSPKTVGARQILRWRDLTVGHDTAIPDNVPLLPVDSSAQMITCELEGDVVFTVRGSGTEPKIKLYIEGRAATAASAKTAAEETLQALLTEWFKPQENGLRLA